MNYEDDANFDSMPVDMGIFTDEQLDTIYDSLSDDNVVEEPSVTTEEVTTTVVDYSILHNDLELIHGEVQKLNNFVSLIFAFLFLYLIYRVFRTCWNILYGWFFGDI